ncbi:MAG: glycoside hydrolase family 52 protein [Thermoleophilaceae bacterium]
MAAHSNAQHAPVEAGSPTHDVLVGARLHDGSCEAGDVTLRVMAPLRPVRRPAGATDSELRDALVPAVLVQLTVDNRADTRARQAFFGLRGAAARAERRGFTVDLGNGRTAGVFCLGDVTAAAADSATAALDRDSGGSGETAVLRFNVRARTRRTFGIAVVSWDGGVAAQGLFDGLEDAAGYALARFGVLAAEREGVGSSGVCPPDVASILWLGDDAAIARLAPVPNGHGAWQR